MAAHGGSWAEYLDTPEVVVEAFARFDAAEARVKRGNQTKPTPQGPVIA